MGGGESCRYGPDDAKGIKAMIPLRIEPFFFLLAALIGWLNSGTVSLTLIWIGVIFISVLVHEYGHALTARLFGQKSMITLTAFGGLTTRKGPHLSAIKEFIIVMNGPLAGILLYGLCAYLLKTPLGKEGAFAYVLSVGSLINLFWTLLNLVPVQPLDGGQLVMILFRGLFGHNGVRIAFLFSLIASVAIGIFFFLSGALLAGSIFLLFAFESFRGFRASLLMTASDEQEPLKRTMEKAISFYQKGEWNKSGALFQQIRREAPKGMLHLAATVKIAERDLVEGRPTEALSLLLPLRKDLEGEELKMLLNAAFQSGDWTLALDIGSELYREQADPEIAVWNAMSAAELSLGDQSVGWLETAAREGVELAPLLSDAHFDPIRQTTLFKEVQSK